MIQNNAKSDPELERFVERSYAELIHFVRSKIPEQDAHELVQDSLTVLVAKRGQVENFRAFTFAVVKNKLRQYYEKQKRGSMLDFLVDMDELVPMSVMSTRLSIRVARSNDLEMAMQKLDRRRFEIFELRYIHDLTIEETAEALETSTATVKREIDRAREQSSVCSTTRTPTTRSGRSCAATCVCRLASEPTSAAPCGWRRRGGCPRR